MASAQQPLARNRSDNSILDLPPHPSALPATQSTPVPVVRERSVFVCQSKVWPPQAQPPATILALPGAKVQGALRPTPLTIAVDAEALMQTDGAASFRSHGALALVKKFLSINEVAPAEHPWVEVVLLSHVPPAQRGRLLDALREAGVTVDRVLFTHERSLTPFLRPCEAMLYLSCDPARVRNAATLGIAAGCILAREGAPYASTAPGVLQLSFDFDGVLADDEAQKVFDAKGLAAFQAHEDAARDVPMGPGPAQPLAVALGRVRDGLTALRAAGHDVAIDLRIGVVTARGAVAMKRLFCTLDAWELAADDVFCLSGRDKTPYVQGLQSDLYIDDNDRHARRAKDITLAVHMPPRSSLQA